MASSRGWTRIGSGCSEGFDIILKVEEKAGRVVPLGTIPPLTFWTYPVLLSKKSGSLSNATRSSRQVRKKLLT